ncbi:MAG: YceH family protein [Gaiellaceae bacterium]
MIHLLNDVELRVLGSLIEKQRTTPEQYPLTLNALRLACNQTTNRDPVLQLDESQVRAAAQSLGTKGYARLATGPGSRTAKYRQLVQEALDLMPAEVSILAVLMLRGPQTVAELKTRTERLHAIDDPRAVLERLSAKDLVRLVARQPGQREERWTHLLGEQGDPENATTTAPETLDARVARLEHRVEELERRLAERGPVE